VSLVIVMIWLAIPILALLLPRIESPELRALSKVVMWIGAIASNIMFGWIVVVLMASLR
jgi:hypothetical protein